MSDPAGLFAKFGTRPADRTRMRPVRFVWEPWLVAGALTAEGMLPARKLGRPMLGYVGAAAVGLASVGLAFAVVR